MEAESAETLELIRRQLPELRAALAEIGFESADVEVVLSNNADRQANGEAPGRHGSGTGSGTRREAPAPTVTEQRPAPRGTSEIDTFV